jgi:putative hydrolase of the HAD superfamily
VPVTLSNGEPAVGPGSWLATRELAARCRVMVFDLDGVIRRFDERRMADRLAELGVDHAQFAAIAFGVHGDLVVTGDISFGEWRERIAEGLVGLGHSRTAAVEATARWVADRGEPIPQTVSLIRQLRAGGTPCFIFTNGTDLIPAELEQLGLSDVADAVINSAQLRVAKPRARAFAEAHQTIEQHLRRSVRRDEVGFVDDRLGNVLAAQEFGWQATHAV